MACFNLRPHHLVCLLSFRGLGYNEEFAIGVGKVVTELKNNRDDKIICVVRGCDDFCKHCPKRLPNNQCEDQEEIEELDNYFLKVLGFCEKDRFSFSTIQQMVKKLSIEEFKQACEDCCWFDVCYNCLYATELKPENQDVVL